MEYSRNVNVIPRSMNSKMEIVPDDGTATLFTVSERLGMHFWIDDDAVFMLSLIHI